MLLEIGDLNDGLGECFGIPDALALACTPLETAPFFATRLQCEVDERGLEVFIPRDDAFLVMLYLSEVRHCDIWRDRPAAPIKAYPRNSICLIDLTEGAGIRLATDLDALAFRIPRALLDELTDDIGEPKILSFPCRRGEMDPVLCHLGAALLPLFDRTDKSATAVVRHMALAFSAHLVHCYGGFPLRKALQVEGLSWLQEKRAKEFMLQHYGEDISVAVIAAAVGLSARHFALGFKSGTGVTPHQWLLKYRIEQAKSFLLSSHMKVEEIARCCGFSDNSHLTNTFTRFVGDTPANWRQLNAH